MNRRTAILATTALLLARVPAAYAASEPIPGVDIIVRRKPPRGKAIAPIQTDRQGMAAFAQLEPGSYDIVVQAGPKQAIRSTVTVGRQRPLVALSDRGNTVTAITLDAAASVQVLVEDATKRP